MWLSNYHRFMQVLDGTIKDKGTTNKPSVRQFDEIVLIALMRDVLHTYEGHRTVYGRCLY